MRHFNVGFSRGYLTAVYGLALVAGSLAFAPAATAVVYRIAANGGIFTSLNVPTQNCGTSPPGTALYGEAVAYDGLGSPICEVSGLGTGLSNGGAIAKCATKPASFRARIVARVPSTQHWDSLIKNGELSQWPQTTTTPGQTLTFPFLGLTGACQGSYMVVQPVAGILPN